ncbi:MAG TPA: hypothetical protein EYH54_04255 [Nautiliaceae bacterium]|nr:hypothetical protein [Nautiliaceae bacterium]
MHKCIKCGKIYENNKEILEKGCECGSKLFIYIPDKNKSTEKKKLKDDILDVKEEEFLILPLESVRVLGEGKFVLDISKLFNEKVVVVRSKEGKYFLKIYR